MPFYQQLLLALADKLVIAAIIVFLGLWINKKLEVFKIELNQLAKERETKHTSLHEKRVEALPKLYALLEDARVHVGVLEVGIEDKLPEQVLEKLAKRVSQPILKAIPLVDENSLYISRELAASISKMLTTMGETSAIPHMSADDRAAALARWKEQSEGIDKSMFELEDEIRVLLGSKVDSPNKALKE